MVARPLPRDARTRSLASNLLLSLRPGQWTKNLLVFAGLIFSQQLGDPQATITATLAFAVFCALSGVVYLVNDVRDREADRQHPLKSRRPIASGAVPPSIALGLAAGLGAAALAAAFWLGRGFVFVSASYLLLLTL